MSPPASDAKVRIRQAQPQDVEAAAQICYDAFRAINEKHAFPPDIPNVDVAKHILAMMFSHAHVYAVVAEVDGRIAGSNCLDERAAVFGVGPITVSPEHQNLGIGRKLMDAVLDRAREQRAAGVRLVQAAFHNRSLSLYASLGFDVREPLACLQGRTAQRRIDGCAVRQARPGDLEACNQLARTVHGFDRNQELAESVQEGSALVVERGGRITGYTSALAFFGHATAETNTDLQALIASADSFAGPGLLLPARNAALFRWCLANGLRVVQPMTLMSMGLYNEPAGAWLPSISL